MWEHTDSDGDIVRFTTDDGASGKVGYLTISKDNGPHTADITPDAAVVLAAQLCRWADTHAVLALPKGMGQAEFSAALLEERRPLLSDRVLSRLRRVLSGAR